MDDHRPSVASVVAAALLLLVAIYLGSYYALVVPKGVGHGTGFSFYRLQYVDPLFWPLEQIDRRVRPSAWFFLHDDGDA